MSGPLDNVDATAVAEDPADPRAPVVEVTDGRAATVGELPVRRVLPRRPRRTVGAWCFADHMGPAQVTRDRGVDIGPHPHIGLQTVTWLVAGEILHRDSLGSEQLIRPGQLNLMTAGNGVAHSEESTGSYAGEVHGLQLWIAQPEATRHGAAAFEHHADLPAVDVGTGDARVLIGSFGGVTSPARADSPLVGVEGSLAAGASTWPLRADFEYAVVVLAGAVGVGDHIVVPGQLGYLGEGRTELVLTCTEPTRLVLLGGEPFDEPVLMWWNYVARTRAEVELAARQWNAQDERFGVVDSPLERIPSPIPPWVGSG